MVGPHLIITAKGLFLMDPHTFDNVFTNGWTAKSEILRLVAIAGGSKAARGRRRAHCRELKVSPTGFAWVRRAEPEPAQQRTMFG
jgi:hypothetical protein